MQLRVADWSCYGGLRRWLRQGRHGSQGPSPIQPADALLYPLDPKTLLRLLASHADHLLLTSKRQQVVGPGQVARPTDRLTVAYLTARGCVESQLAALLTGVFGHFGRVRSVMYCLTKPDRSDEAPSAETPARSCGDP